MNILILSHSYPDESNKYRGIFIKEQAIALSSIHNIIVVYFRVDYSSFYLFSKPTYKKKSSSNLIEYELIIKRSLPVINQFKYLRQTYSFLKNEIFKHVDIDVIHSHLAYPGGFLGAIINKRTRLPTILTEHSSIKSYYRSFIHKLCVRYTYKNIPHIICVSRSLRKEVVKSFNRDVIVVPNMVNVEQFCLKESKKRTKINIGFLGSLNNMNKGLDLLLKSLSIVDSTNLKLHIGGNGKLLDYFKQMATNLGVRQFCEFHGEITASKKSEYFSSLDFFVLPSRYETFGIVLIEAMASGVPVIATKCGGPQEIVTKDTGILVQKDDVIELAESIRTMLKKYDSYDRFIIRQYAEQNFGKSAFIQRISTIYRESIFENERK